MLSIEKQLRSLYEELVAKEKIVHSANVVANLKDKVARIVATIENDILKTQGYIVAEKKEQRKIIVGE